MVVRIFRLHLLTNFERGVLLNFVNEYITVSNSKSVCSEEGIVSFIKFWLQRKNDNFVSKILVETGRTKLDVKNK